MALELMSKEEKQKAFPVLLYNRGGDVTQTCNDIGISRATWRKWAAENEEFAQSCIDATESLVDLATGKLIDNVRKGISRDIQFLLKTLGRNRGFGEQVTVDHTGVIAHAHGIKHYPPEPQSIEEWEKQVSEAEKAQTAQAANTCESGPNHHVGALSAPNALDTLPDNATDAEIAGPAIAVSDSLDSLDVYADLAMIATG